MNDFLFTRDPERVKCLTAPLKKLMPEPESVSVVSFVGEWGALAASSSPYKGFEPYEDNNYICVVIAGPVLCWCENEFLVSEYDSNIGTQRIFERWRSGEADWSEDLSGPFVIFIVNKEKHEFFCYTDLMMFIPVYKYENYEQLYLGTHVDAVAEVAQQIDQIDEVSIADFILHGIVTYPYTVYKDIFQLAPATKHCWVTKEDKLVEQREAYWLPVEENPYKTIEEAAEELRSGLADYIYRVTKHMKEVGHFISAGEDSRSIAGMLPEEIKRHAYIYVDSKNREFKIAKKVAEAYGCEFNYILRSPTHYLDIMPVASKLVGSGQQYTHAHTLELAKKSGADKHFAVFGGYGADSLLKGMHARKSKYFKSISFIPEKKRKGESRTTPLKSKAFNKDITSQIDIRRASHMEYIKGFRKGSEHEWFMLWPYTMREAMPNISVNRRLFKSYEIFLGKSNVFLTAKLPSSWKLNRVFFNVSCKRYLFKSRFIPHQDARLPYYSWRLNIIFSFYGFFCKVLRKVTKKNEGAWGDLNNIIDGIDLRVERNKYFCDIERLNVVQQINYKQISRLSRGSDVL